MQSQNIELEFLGSKITLKTDGDNELVDEVVNLVKTRLEDARMRAKGAAPFQVALLGMLDLAEAYVKAKHGLIEERQEISGKSSQLMEIIQGEIH